MVGGNDITWLFPKAGNPMGWSSQAALHCNVLCMITLLYYVTLIQLMLQDGIPEVYEWVEGGVFICYYAMPSQPYVRWPLASQCVNVSVPALLSVSILLSSSLGLGP